MHKKIGDCHVNVDIPRILQYFPRIFIHFLDENEPHRDKTNTMVCAPSEDSVQPRLPPSLIRVFAMHLMGS